MSDRKYDNSGTLGKNNRKEEPQHSDMNGKGLIDGVEYWINGWRKEGSSGPFISLSFRKVEPRKTPKKDKPEGEVEVDDFF